MGNRIRRVSKKQTTLINNNNINNIKPTKKCVKNVKNKDPHDTKSDKNGYSAHRLKRFIASYWQSDGWATRGANRLHNGVNHEWYNVLFFRPHCPFSL